MWIDLIILITLHIESLQVLLCVHFDHFEKFLNQFASISIVSRIFFISYSYFLYTFCFFLFNFFHCCCNRKRNRRSPLFIYCTLSKTLSPVHSCISVFKWNLQWNTKWEMVAVLFIPIAFKLNCCRVISFHSSQIYICYCVSVYVCLPVWITSKANRWFSF